MDQLSGYLGLPDDAEMFDRNKPGSLPDLTNFHVNPAAAMQSNHSGVGCVGGVGGVGNNVLAMGQHQQQQLFEDDQGSPYSSVSGLAPPSFASCPTDTHSWVFFSRKFRLRNFLSEG